MGSPFKKPGTNPKLLFLIDGLGALLSALFLGIILVHFEDIFGMPQAVLYPLAGVACLFAVYSLCCYVLVRRRWAVFFWIIALANVLYACATLGLLVIQHDALTCWGWGYFVLELGIIGGLVGLEIKAASKKG